MRCILYGHVPRKVPVLRGVDEGKCAVVCAECGKVLQPPVDRSRSGYRDYEELRHADN